MKKQIGLLLALVMVMNVIGTVSFASTSPLEKYNLYDDVMGGGSSSSANNDRERVTNDFYNNSMRPGSENGNVAGLTEEEIERQKKEQSLQQVLDSVESGETVGERNKNLRESSTKVYSDPATPEPWLKEISFYSRPTLDGIRESYRKSNFAAALQESTSFINNKGFVALSNEQKTMAYYYLAMSYAKCGQKENAIRAYEKVIALNDSPMIVKYATNGRNCVMQGDNSTETCYINVNEPELIHPYANISDNISPADLTPIDPETLVNRNMAKMQKKMFPDAAQADSSNSTGKGNEKELNLPFGTQDAELDKFINAPYGNGLSPQFNEEYKQIQLRSIQKRMNSETDSVDIQRHNYQDVKKLDKKSDLGTIKLAYDAESVYDKIQKDPEYIRQKQEFEEISRMFGNGSKDGDLTDLLPYVTEQGEKKLSPEVIQALMMQSMMNDLTL